MRKTLLGLLQEPPTHLPLVHFPLGKSTSSTNNTNPGYSNANHQVIFRYVSRYNLHYPQSTVLAWIFPGFSRYKPSEKRVFFLTILHVFFHWGAPPQFWADRVAPSGTSSNSPDWRLDDNTKLVFFCWLNMGKSHGKMMRNMNLWENIWEMQGISDDIKYLQNWFKDV